MGQNNNHKSNFHFLILGCKSFAVNYSLKSGTHRHHQTLGFIPGDALPGLYCNRLQFLLVLGAFSLQFCLQQVKCMLNRIQVRWLTWPLHNSPLLSLQKLFGCFCSMLWVIVHLHCEAPSNEFWSIWLNMSSRGATDHRWSVIRTDQSPRFGTHVIRGLTDKFNHHRVKVYHLHALRFLRSAAAAHTEARTHAEREREKEKRDLDTAFQTTPQRIDTYIHTHTKLC